MNTEEILEQYSEKGYYVFRNVLDTEYLSEIKNHIDWLQEKYDVESPEHLHHPLMRDDAFWVRLISDARVLDIAKVILGNHIVCFTSHYICKPPRVGVPVYWHQDAAYWNITPMNAVSLWLAIDQSSIENGCLRFIPGSHKNKVHPLIADQSNKNMLSSTLSGELFNKEEAVAIQLNPGDISIHHPNIIHGSQENKSDNWRRGLDIGYTVPDVLFGNTNLYMSPFLLTESAIDDATVYSPWPKYDSKTSFHFNEHHDWDAKANYINKKYGFSHPKEIESVMDITKRMTQRLASTSTSTSID
jgi:ectoine hydroxylase-related dioxygenase (phytanoyl-CoA dioxygenase family)